MSAGKATIFGAGTAPMSWISVGDVAEYAVRSLDDERLANRVVPLGGPQALPPNAVVEIFEQASGRKFSAIDSPVQRELALPLVTLQDYATRVTSS